MDDVLKIENLKGGAVIEMANKELQKMVDDIADVNKEASSKRELTIKVSLHPTEDASFGACKMAVTSTLGTQKPQTTSLSFGFDGKKGIASERLNVSQPNFASLTADEHDN